MSESCNSASHGAPLGHDEICNKRAENASFSDASNGSLCSSASNLSDETTSSPCHNPSEPSSASSSMLELDAEGPMFELTSLLVQLPIRKGLSKYYQGKSQSFKSISNATCVQDLAKKVPYSKRMKTCKSYAEGLDMSQLSNNLPRPCKIIAKKPSKNSSAIVQQCQIICSPEQEICANAYCFVTKRKSGNK